MTVVLVPKSSKSESLLVLISSQVVALSLMFSVFLDLTVAEKFIK